MRDDIENYVQSRLGGLQEEVARLQSQLNEAFTRLQERVEAAGQSDPSIAVAIAEHLRYARNEGVETAAEGSARARASSDVAIIKAAVDDLGSQRTQADILDALVNRAASFAPRVAFFVVKNERATGWRARGLEGTVGDDSVREISLPLAADTLLGKVAQARSTWSGTPGTHAEDNSIYGRFGDEPPQRIVAVPLVARDKSVAVLYADSAGLDADAVNLEAIEALVRVAGIAVELLAAKRPAAAEAKPSASAEHAAADAAPPPAAVTQPRPEEPQPEPDPRFAREEAPPAPVSVEPEAFGSEDAGPQAAAPAEALHDDAAPPPTGIEPHVAADDADSPSPTGVEPYTPHAESFAPAAETVAPPASSTDATPLASSSSARRYGTMDMDFPVEVTDEDKRFHNEARRFARLLVSEIKLYNEQKVRDGRDAGDLYDRLREDIDRSRQMYDKRVRPEVAGRYDYFHHELVSALAEGDPAKLGEGYPGASVNV
ncbi:MAG TPA: GAF domain-containing protein [Pyrinomonadaceae bacterium]